MKNSFVNMVPSKVEVTLKKANAVAWSKLEDSKHKPEPEVTEDISKTEQMNADEKPDWYISDDDISESDWEDEDDDDKKGEEEDVDGPPFLEQPQPVPPKK